MIFPTRSYVRIVSSDTFGSLQVSRHNVAIYVAIWMVERLNPDTMSGFLSGWQPSRREALLFARSTDRYDACVGAGCTPGGRRVATHRERPYPPHRPASSTLPPAVDSFSHHLAGDKRPIDGLGVFEGAGLDGFVFGGGGHL